MASTSSPKTDDKLIELYNFVVDTTPSQEAKVKRVLSDLNVTVRERALDVINIMTRDDDRFDIINYSMDDFRMAAKVCKSSRSMEQYLLNHCDICLSYYSRENLVYFVCGCYYCRACFPTWFLECVKKREVRDWVCPNCKNRKDVNVYERETLEAHLSHLNLLSEYQPELMPEKVKFQRKLAIYVASRDAKFVWCAWGCDYGVVAFGNEKPVKCPECQKLTCKDCRYKWQTLHKNLSCEEFISRCDEELVNLLKDSGTICPNCKLVTDVAPGGCLHIDCVNCNTSFCSGCRGIFYNWDDTNGKANPCDQPQHKEVNFHAHHPRNCACYLRDWTVENLKKLLTQGSNKDYRQARQYKTQPGSDRCSIQTVMKGAGTDSIEGRCTKKALEGSMCKKHFKLFLIRLINNCHLEPLQLMSIDEMIIYMKKNYISAIAVPQRKSDSTDKQYADILKQTIMAAHPLPKLGMGK